MVPGAVKVRHLDDPLPRTFSVSKYLVIFVQLEILCMATWAPSIVWELRTQGSFPLIRHSRYSSDYNEVQQSY